MKNIISLSACRAAIAASSTLLALGFSAQAASSFTAVHAFGDSLTDSGNVFMATRGDQPAAPNVDGRYSNGPTWVEVLTTDHLGLPPISNSLAGGTNHAWGGAWTSGGDAVPSVLDQIGLYVGGGGDFASTDLITIWAGANDFFFGPQDPAASVANISTALDMVAASGAKHVLVMNLPNLGATPAIGAQGLDAVTGMTALSGGFNALLAGAIASQRDALGISIYEADIYTLNADIILNPGNYGLTNATLPASLIGEVENANEFAYWDGVHPTDPVHRIFAQTAANALIPEPSSALLVLGSTVLLATRRRRACAA